MKEQPLFKIPETWERHWTPGLPEFKQDNAEPFDSISVHFRNKEDREAFLRLLGEKPERRKSIWYPKMEYLQQSTRNAEAATVPAGRYPVYVISKGRWESRLTVNALNKLGIYHYLVVEPTEAERYAENKGAFTTILQLPFHDLGQGSIPARNWVWEHAIETETERHWILDDNMDGFYRLNKNLKTKVVDENPLIPVEDFADNYVNVGMAGLNYEFFAARRSKQPPFRLNTRIYSCILLRNDLPFRWRGRYNEDTDLSLRILKAGHCTVLFNAYLCKKMPTMTMKGGNTDELYKQDEGFDGRLEMAKSLQEQHPDVTTITRKWNRWQHHVDYSRFKHNKLLPVKRVIVRAPNRTIEQ